MEKLKPYTKEWLEELCANSSSLAEVLKKAGRRGGGTQTSLKKKIDEFNIDISHFTGQKWNKGKTAKNDPRIAKQSKNNEKYSLEEVFCKNSPITQHGLKGYIERYNLIPYKCAICGCDGNWQNGKITLEIHHKDGDSSNNELSNLEYRCPNCHALSENFRKKKSDNSTIISEEEFCKALKATPNIRQALIMLGLNPQGSNYDRAKKLLIKYNITQK